MFLFVLPGFSQLSGTIEQNPVNSAYTVSVIPSVTWVPPMSVTSGATITLRANTGKFQLSDFQSITGVWISTGVFVSPSEAPNFDYFTFALQLALPSVTYNNGVKLPLFSFKNVLGCTAIEIIDNQSDPFLEPNSQNISITNYFSIVGAGAGANAYVANDAQDFIFCPPLSIAATASTNPVLCHGDVTDFFVAVSGGKEPYEILWQNTTTNDFGNFQIQNFDGSTTLNGMPAGNYIFTVVDQLDSTMTTNLLLAQPAQPLTIEMLALDASCNGSMDGEVQVEKAKGGTAVNGYSYQWAGLPSEVDSIVTAVGVGLYSVTVTDDNGCTATGSTTIGATGNIVLSQTTVKNVSCKGAENGLIDLYPISPSLNTDFDFAWSSNVTTANESAAYQLGPGTYSVTVTDIMAGCVTEATFTITEPPAIEIDYRLTEPKCFGEQGILEILGISYANEPWEAVVEGGENIADGDRFLIEPGLPLTLIVEDKKGCIAKENFIVPAKQELQLEVGEGRDIKYGEEVNIETSFFPFENVSFQWTPEIGLSCTDCPDPVAAPTDGITYRLQMTDTAGCTTDDYINISVRKSRDIYIPNSFSPNNDGINDTFYPYGGFEIVAIHSMQVYDRWGGKMFEATERFSPNDETAGWNGSAKNNKFADAGTYLYTMNVEFIDGEIILFSGEVNLMK